MNHALYGVERGRKTSATGAPIEIMGLCVGHMDPEDNTAFVITDAFPLPVEGSEYNVVAESEEFDRCQSNLLDFFGDSRKDALLGWYHSHPFDVKKHSNCFFSMTDVIQQRSWQSITDHSDFSFVGFVIDPLRSLAKGRPDIGAFRTYPGGYNRGKKIAPDGVKHKDEASIVERWGNAYLSYQSIPVELFSSSLADTLLSALSRDFLWRRALSAAPGRDAEAVESTAGRLQKVAGDLSRAARSMQHVGRAHTALAGVDGAVQNPHLAEASATSAQLSMEQARSQSGQLVKHALFNASVTGGVSGEAPVAAGAGGAAEGKA